MHAGTFCGCAAGCHLNPTRSFSSLPRKTVPELRPVAPEPSLQIRLHPTVSSNLVYLSNHYSPSRPTQNLDREHVKPRDFGMEASQQLEQKPPACSVCRMLRPARHYRSYGNSDFPTLYSRNYKRRPLSLLLDSQRLGCRGCGLAVDAIEAWQTGWAADHTLSAVVGIKLDDSRLFLRLYLPPIRKTIQKLTVFRFHG